MATILDLMFAINKEDVNLYYHRDTNSFDHCPLSPIEVKNIHTRMHEEITVGYKDPNNVRFLTFKQINHKELMRDFVKSGIVYDKDIKKKLFDSLRYHDYVEPFIARLKELDYYDDYIDFTICYYEGLFEDWQIENDVKLI